MKSKRGTAILIVLVLLAVMSTYALANGATIRGLTNYLQDLDKRQQQKFLWK